MADTGLNDLDKKWFDFTSSYVTKLNEAKQDWNALPEKEQELAALWKLEMDMYNGGFIQFFCNWGYDCYTHAIRSLNRLDAQQCLAIVRHQFAIIQRLEDDSRLEALWDIPKYLSKDEAEALDALDEQYWENTDGIVEKTFRVYQDMLQ
ncbi:MAG: DMP19 family protein [Cytophagales bacterium]|jgi:hypothetical protein|nr:DMP19 family protein [Cytophagales bacterium]